MKKPNTNIWEDFVNSFFNLIELACKEIQTPKHTELVGDIEMKSQYNQELNVAIIYNMKHAIEICIKTLIRLADDSFEEKIDTHEIPYLLKLLKYIYSKENIKDVIMNINDTQDCLASFAQQELKQLPTYLIEIEKIANYYYELDFLDKNNTTKDEQNTLFKYPEDKKKQVNEINYIYFSLEDLDIEKIKEDINNLKHYLNIIKTISIVYNSNSPR